MSMRRLVTVLVSMLTSSAAVEGGALAAPGLPAGPPQADLTPAAALERLNHRRGIVALVGDPRGEFAVELARRSELIVYLQVETAQEVDAARTTARDAGLYGSRVYVERGTPNRIHLADNLADAVILRSPASGLQPPAEALRVVRPRGKVLVGEQVLTKPFPPGADDWSHPHHGPDNNPVSADRLIRAPYLTQFVTEATFAPMPQLAVASAGRVFKLYGHMSLKPESHALVNQLVALNGYNGTVLWQRQLKPGFMPHRNTLIATPTTLYLADDESCKLIDPATGAVKDEITFVVAPSGAAGDALTGALQTDLADGPVWKWMALENGVLYALLGKREEEAAEVRLKSWVGWSWKDTSPGFFRDRADYTWLAGRTLLAIDPATKKVLWRRQEAQEIDGRAVCMKAGRLFFFRFGAFLTCLDARDGREVWRKTPENAPDIFRALGNYLAGSLNAAKGGGGGFSSNPYMLCDDKVVCLTGLPIDALAVVSAQDGRLLRGQKYLGHPLLDGEAMHLIGYGGQADRGALTVETLTGKVLRETVGGISCARATACPDGIFYRGAQGTLRLDPATGRIQHLALMRPTCTDGVTIAGGHLYWWPWQCGGCNLSLLGVVCVGPAGDFQFGRDASDPERLEVMVEDVNRVAPLPESPGDWPTFRPEGLNWPENGENGVRPQREDIKGSDPIFPVFRPRAEPQTAQWEQDLRLAPGVVPTAPTTAGGLVFIAAADGVVRCLDAASGQVRWTAATGGPIRFPPTIWKGRSYVGSGDGWAYCLEAATGKPLWRFRAAPVERKIAFAGSLSSTWPVTPNIVVSGGVAYLAAGIANYDGAHVYALDAVTGRIRWQNNTSGRLNAENQSGVSVQGQLLLVDDRLYLAGGNVVSPAVYDAASGKCLSAAPPRYDGRAPAPPDAPDRKLLTDGEQYFLKPAPPHAGTDYTLAPAGWRLTLQDGRVAVSGDKFYAPRSPFRSEGGPAVLAYAEDAAGRTVLVRRNGRVLGGAR
jgi:outer membrane protein assembly factor BamB